MNCQAMRWALEQDEVPSSEDKFVLLALASEAMPSGVAPAKIPYLACATNLSEDRVASALRRLDQGGWIHDMGTRVGKLRNVTVYYLEWVNEECDADPGGLRRDLERIQRVLQHSNG